MKKHTDSKWLMLLAGAVVLAGCAGQPVARKPAAPARPAPVAEVPPPPQPAAVEALAPAPVPMPAPEPVLAAPEPESPIVQPLPLLFEEELIAEAPSLPASDDDVWARLGRQFTLAREHHHQFALQREVAWYRRNMKYIARVSERAAPFLHYIAEEVEKRGMPAEIALLPIVESAFQPYAYSQGRAAGLWQFIPTTATDMGLRLSWWYDGRRDVVESTRAALDYLQRLHKMFDGDWLLALAAYNNGHRFIKNAVAANRAAGLPTDFWSLRLRSETTAYVPRLLAVATVVAQAPRVGLQLHPIPNKPYFTKVEIHSQMDLAIAAELAGLRADELFKLNPAFNRWATDPDGPHHLILPADRAELFEARLAELPADQRMRYRRHEIAKGETLNAVARRFDTSVTVLRRINNLDPRAKVKAGQEILIPLALDARRAENEKMPRGKSAAPRDRERGAEYVVRKGDTLYEIARQNGVTVADIREWNGLGAGAAIQPGQKLALKASAAPAAPDDKFAHLPLLTPDNNAIKRRISYTVKDGDSLKAISRKFNVAESELRKWNSLKRKEKVQPGRTITLYVDITNLAETS